MLGKHRNVIKWVRKIIIEGCFIYLKIYKLLSTPDALFRPSSRISFVSYLVKKLISLLVKRV